MWNSGSSNTPLQPHMAITAEVERRGPSFFVDLVFVGLSCICMIFHTIHRMNRIPFIWITTSSVTVLGVMAVIVTHIALMTSEDGDFGWSLATVMVLFGCGVSFVSTSA